jgi:hypothetical protein
MKDGVLKAEEVERLKFDFESALCLASIPRRLGFEASSRLLAIDAKLGRRMANVALRCLQWHGAAEPWMADWREAMKLSRTNEEAYGEGARRQWVIWYYDRETWIDQHIPRVARWGVVTGNRQEANQLCSRLNGELYLMQAGWHRTAPFEWREAEDLPDKGSHEAA